MSDLALCSNDSSNNSMFPLPWAAEFFCKVLTKQNMFAIINLGDSMSDWYSYDAIDKIDSVYKIIIGERSNGKTYGWCKKVLEEYLKTGTPSAYIRRHDEQIKPRNLQKLFHPQLDWVEEATKGKWNGIKYYLNNYYLIRTETLPNGETKRVAEDKNEFCRAYAISTAETSKGADRGAVKYICFDEFITRQFYLQNEFVMYQNLLSSIIRKRSGIIIYMLANTVNRYCPYFRDMGLSKAATQTPGTIDVYKIGKTESQIAMEYCAESGKNPTVKQYFAFDNPQLEMITSGAWEIALYRHAPPQLSSARIILSFFVIFTGQVIQGDIHMYQGYPIVFFHPKSTQIKNPEKTIIYTQDTTDSNPLHQTDVRIKPTKAHALIADLFNQKKTFYSDNETGEVINNWLKEMISARNSIKI